MDVRVCTDPDPGQSDSSNVSAPATPLLHKLN